MENTPIFSLEEKIKQLVDKYKVLHKKHEALIVEKDDVELAHEELKEAFQQQEGKIQVLKDNITQKEQEIINLTSEKEEMLERLEKFENKTKSAASRIDEILDQINQL